MGDLAFREEGGSVCFGDMFGLGVGEDEVCSAGVFSFRNDSVDWERVRFHNKYDMSISLDFNCINYYKLRDISDHNLKGINCSNNISTS